MFRHKSTVFESCSQELNVKFSDISVAPKDTAQWRPARRQRKKKDPASTLWRDSYRKDGQKGRRESWKSETGSESIKRRKAINFYEEHTRVMGDGNDSFVMLQ